jgi:hypothetical protein
VITARGLVQLGVPESTVYRRARNGGPWQRLLPGVLLLSNGTPSTQQLVTAALLYSGPDSMLTGMLACRRHGVRRGPTPPFQVHVLVPHARQLRSTGFVLVERTRRLPDPVGDDGVPLAPPARACIDTARRLSDPREVTELLGDAVQRGLCQEGYSRV